VIPASNAFPATRLASVAAAAAAAATSTVPYEGEEGASSAEGSPSPCTPAPSMAAGAETAAAAREQLRRQLPSGIRTPTASPAAGPQQRGGASSPSAALLAFGMLAAAPLAGGGGSGAGSPLGGMSPRVPAAGGQQHQSGTPRGMSGGLMRTAGVGVAGSPGPWAGLGAAAASAAVLQGAMVGRGGQAAILPALTPFANRATKGVVASAGQEAAASPRGSPASYS